MSKERRGLISDPSEFGVEFRLSDLVAPDGITPVFPASAFADHSFASQVFYFAGVDTLTGLPIIVSKDQAEDLILDSRAFVRSALDVANVASSSITTEQITGIQHVQNMVMHFKQASPKLTFGHDFLPATLPFTWYASLSVDRYVHPMPQYHQEILCASMMMRTFTWTISFSAMSGAEEQWSWQNTVAVLSARARRAEQKFSCNAGRLRIYVVAGNSSSRSNKHNATLVTLFVPDVGLCDAVGAEIEGDGALLLDVAQTLRDPAAAVTSMAKKSVGLARLGSLIVGRDACVRRALHFLVGSVEPFEAVGTLSCRVDSSSTMSHTDVYDSSTRIVANINCSVVSTKGVIWRVGYPSGALYRIMDTRDATLYPALYPELEVEEGSAVGAKSIERVVEPSTSLSNLLVSE